MVKHNCWKICWAADSQTSTWTQFRHWMLLYDNQSRLFVAVVYIIWWVNLHASFSPCNSSVRLLAADSVSSLTQQHEGNAHKKYNTFSKCVILFPFHTMNYKFRLNNISKYEFSSYLTENTVGLNYKHHPVKFVQGSNRCVLWEH